MEVQGRVKMIDETKTYGNNGFRKREVVITTEEQYPQHILVEFVQDREWVNPQGETKYFNSIQGWRIENLQQENSTENIPPVAPIEAFEPADNVKQEDHDDLPF